MPLAARLRFPTGVTIGGHTLSIAAELSVVAVFAAVFLVLAVRGLGRTEYVGLRGTLPTNLRDWRHGVIRGTIRPEEARRSPTTEAWPNE